MKGILSIATGIPTEADVRKLVDKFGTPEPGTIISWDKIETALGIKKESNRFRTVVVSWRKQLWNQHNCLMSAKRGEGLECLDPRGRVANSAGSYKSGLRKIGRASRIVERTNTEGLTPDDRRVADHIRNAGAAIRLLAATKAKELPPAK